MDKQNERIILRIDGVLKKKFKEKCDKEHMLLSTRLKFLIQKDIEGKLKVDA